MIKSSVTDLLSGAESGEIWIKRISRLPENLPTADHKLSFSAHAKILGLLVSRAAKCPTIETLT